MEPRFICEFPLTEALLANRFRKYNAVRCSIMLVIGIVAFAMIVRAGIWGMIFYGFSSYWLFMILFACAILLYGIFWPTLSAKAQLRRYRKELGTEQYRVYFGDTIEIQEGSLSISWSYSDITRVAHWKYTVELQKSKTLAIMLDPSGFTKGTYGEFRTFLQEKRPDLIIPE